MVRFKDWEEGESRVKTHIVLGSGSSLNFYVPHLTPEQGEAAATLLTQLVLNRKITLSWIDRKTGKQKRMTVGSK